MISILHLQHFISWLIQYDAEAGTTCSVGKSPTFAWEIRKKSIQSHVIHKPKVNANLILEPERSLVFVKL